MGTVCRHIRRQCEDENQGVFFPAHVEIVHRCRIVGAETDFVRILQCASVPVHFFDICIGSADVVFNIGLFPVFHVKADGHDIFDRLQRQIACLLQPLFILISAVSVRCVRTGGIGQNFIVVCINQMGKTHRHHIDIGFQLRADRFLRLSYIFQRLLFKFSVERDKRNVEHRQYGDDNKKQEGKIVDCFQGQLLLFYKIVLFSEIQSNPSHVCFAKR